MPLLLAPALVSLGVSASVAGPISSILFAGLSFALSLLFAPKVPKPENVGRIPFKQSVPPRARILNRRRTAGAFMLYHSLPQGTFFGVSALCDGEVKEFTRYYLHDDVVALQGDGHTVGSPGAGRYGDDKISIYTRKGLVPETAYADAVAGLSPLWTDDHRGDGIASALLVAADAGLDDQAKRFPFGLPVLSLELDATRVLDPRDVDQDWTDPGTWSFTGNDNPILQTMWFLTAPIKDGGMGLDFGECFSTVLTDVSAQADICDEAVALKAGGTEKRYRSQVLYHYSDDPGDVLASILGTCDGFLAERGDGAFELKAGKWDDADFAVVIKDKHIISNSVRRFRPDEDEVTGVIVKYNSIPHEHTTVDAPVWPRDAYQGGEDRRVRTIEIVNCPSGTQAQRLSKRVAIYEMAPISGTMVLKMFGVLLLDRRGATIQCTDDPALADAKVRLTRVEPNIMAGTVTIDYTVFDPTVCDAWNAATEEGPLQPVVTVPFDEAFSTPSSLNAVPSQISGTVYVEISFDPGVKAGPNTNYRYQWRLADIGGGVPGGWTSGSFSADAVERPSPSLWVVTINGMPAGYLEFQLQAYQHDHSAWSASAFADTRIPAPGRPTSFTAALAGADVDLDWTSPNSANFDHARVYRALSGAGFGLASDISGPLAGSPATPMTYLDVAPASGTYDYWVTAENTANVASLPRGPATVTVP
jgi:hypothetical protein